MAKRQHECIASPAWGLFESLCVDALECIVTQIDFTDISLILTLLRTARAWFPLLKRRLDEWMRRALVSDAVIASISLVAIQRFTKNCLERTTFHTPRHYTLALGALDRINKEYAHLGRATRLDKVDAGLFNHLQTGGVYYYDGTRQPINICNFLGVQSADMTRHHGVLMSRFEPTHDRAWEFHNMKPCEQRALIFAEMKSSIVMKPTRKCDWLSNLVYLGNHIFSKECVAFRQHCYVVAESIRDDPASIQCAISASVNHDLLHQSIDQRVAQYPLLAY